jgi:hypothetical protein
MYIKFHPIYFVFVHKLSLSFVCVSVFAEDSADGGGQSAQRKNALTLLDPNFSNFQRGTRQTRVSNNIFNSIVNFQY